MKLIVFKLRGGFCAYHYPLDDLLSFDVFKDGRGEYTALKVYFKSIGEHFVVYDDIENQYKRFLDFVTGSYSAKTVVLNEVEKFQ